MLAGLNPAQGLIFMLQALGGKLISRDMAMRELPFTVNVTQELEKIEIEDMRAALLGSLTANDSSNSTDGNTGTRCIRDSTKYCCGYQGTSEGSSPRRRY
jgi:hypothetical protein